MEGNTRKAFSEVYDIINHMDDEMKNKIPKEFIKFIGDNQEFNYKVKIDYSQGINNQNLIHETKVLLSLIYRDYICNKEKKERLIRQDNKILKEQEENLRKKYEINFEKIKENRKNKEKEENKTVSLTVVKEYKWYEKIFKFIRNLFKVK